MINYVTHQIGQGISALSRKAREAFDPKELPSIISGIAVALLSTHVSKNLYAAAGINPDDGLLRTHLKGFAYCIAPSAVLGYITIVAVKFFQQRQFRQKIEAWASEATPGENRRKAAARILTAIERRSTRLNLAQLGLSSLPSKLFQHLPQLTNLDLSSNSFTEIPAEISQLTQLTHLDLSHNRLAALPQGIFDHLLQLTYFSLSFNQLAELPQRVFDHLLQLTFFGLSNNRLAALPQGIFDHLPRLAFLILLNNRLAELPQGVFDHLPQLKHLDLSRNQLAALPQGVFDRLPQLALLDLSRNQLAALPQRALHHLALLRTLSLVGNPMRLPENFQNLYPQIRELILPQHENIVVEVIPEHVIPEEEREEIARESRLLTLLFPGNTDRILQTVHGTAADQRGALIRETLRRALAHEAAGLLEEIPANFNPFQLPENPPPGLDVHAGNRDRRTRAALVLLWRQEAIEDLEVQRQLVQGFIQSMETIPAPARAVLERFREAEAQGVTLGMRLAQEAALYLKVKEAERLRTDALWVLQGANQNNDYGPLLKDQGFAFQGFPLTGQGLIARLFAFAGSLQEPDRSNVISGMIRALQESITRIDPITQQPVRQRVCDQGKTQQLAIAALQGYLPGVQIDVETLTTPQAMEVFFSDQEHGARRRAMDSRAALIQEARRFLDGNLRVRPFAFLIDLNRYADAEGLAL